MLSSDDPETHDTFAHLPGWELAETVDNVFGVWLWMHGDIDLSAHDDRVQRMRLALNGAAWRELLLDEKTRGENGQPDLGRLSRQVMGLRQTVKAVVALPEWQDVILPEPLPSDLQVAIQDLPAPHQPPAELVSAVVAHHPEAHLERPES